MSDPYKVLGVSPYATDDEISKAYKNLAKKYHPDNYTDNPLADLATEKMQEINQKKQTIPCTNQSRLFLILFLRFGKIIIARLD